MGTAQLTRPYGITSGDESDTTERRPSQILQSAQQMGCVAIDTAPIYGASEIEIGKAEIALPIHTKLDPSLTIRDSVDESLRKLKRGSLDIVYFHDRLRPPDIVKIDVAVRSSLESQLVHRLGVSVYDLAELKPLEASLSISAVQAPFSVLDRRFSAEVFGDFVDSGGQVLLRSVFLQGLLTAHLENIPPHLYSLRPFLMDFWKICAEWDVNPVDGALQFVHRKLPFARLVVGVTRVDELSRIMKAQEAEISEGYFLALDQMNLPDRDIVDPRRW